MTMEMIPALGILVLMIVLIMSDKMPDWRTATACVFIAGCIGTFDRSTGFCRIRQSSVVMIAGFMVVMAALQNPAYQQR